MRNYRTFVEGTQGSQVTDTSDVRKQPTGTTGCEDPAVLFRPVRFLKTRFEDFVYENVESAISFNRSHSGGGKPRTSANFPTCMAPPSMLPPLTRKSTWTCFRPSPSAFERKSPIFLSTPTPVSQPNTRTVQQGSRFTRTMSIQSRSWEVVSSPCPLELHGQLSSGIRSVRSRMSTMNLPTVL